MKNYQQLSMDDIIFENRNKQYGAYQLRQNIDKHAIIGLMITLSSFIALMIVYLINPISKNYFTKPEIVIEHTLTNIDEILPPQVIPPELIKQAQTAKVNTTDFREINTVPDVVANTISPASQEVAANANLGTSAVTDGTDKPSFTEVVTNPTTAAFTETAAATPTITEEIIRYADVMPSFNGGNDAMIEYLRKNIKPFQSDIENGLSGKVILRFYIDTDGTVRNPEVMKDNAGGRCAEAAINAVKKMPKWNAGKQNGKAVKVYFTLPVTFNFTVN